MNHCVIIVFLCYGINPFMRKIAIANLNDYTGYALIQFTTVIGNSLYLIKNKHLLSFNDITYRSIHYSITSSALTVISSYHMNKLLKDNSASNITTKIQILTIITSYIIDYLFNHQKLTIKQTIGLLFMISGILISKK